MSLPTTESEQRRFTTVHNRYHVACSCCGLVATEQRKMNAVRSMRDHMERHDLAEQQTFSVYDSMHRRGGRVVYGGRIHGGIRSHGIGVAYSVETGKAVSNG